MRIAYGVMGYGRGHSSRARAVLPALMRQHEVTVYAGGDAFDMLSADFPTVRIPTLGYAYGRDGAASFLGTLRANAGPTFDLLRGGDSVRTLESELRRRGTELVISDSEAWTHRAARRLGLPRIGFDHVGVIAYCEPHFPPELALRGRRDAWGYRRLMGIPDRIVVSSFYPARPRTPGTVVVGSILRPEVHEVRRASGEHLLAYFNRGHLQYTPTVEQALADLDLPVIVYGTPHEGVRENLVFRRIDPRRFLEDLASCRAVLATAGNQLIGEALHLRKPILALPERVFEQELNAWTVEQLGIGQRGSLNALTAADIELFLAGAEACVARMADIATDGLPAALAALHQAIDDLAGTRAPRRSPGAGAPVAG